MKRRIVFIAILTAMICAALVSGCSDKEVMPKGTEPTTTASTVVTTVAPTSEITETTEATSTAVETNTMATTVVAVPTDTAPQTEAPKVENEKPQAQKPSSNTNENSTATQKPAPDREENKSSDNKPNNDTAQAVTDDTKLTHVQFSTSENMERISSALNDHFIGRGMILDTTLTIDNSGWMFAYQGSIDKTATRSYNEHLNRIIIGMDEQVDAMNDMYGVDCTGVSFNCYAELQSDGEYNIYYCYR